VSDPKGMFEKYLGQRLPEDLHIIIHEGDASTLHLSIPQAPPNLTELSDGGVTPGQWWNRRGCNNEGRYRFALDSGHGCRNHCSGHGQLGW